MFLTPFKQGLESFGIDIDTLPLDEEVAEVDPNDNKNTDIIPETDGDLDWAMSSSEDEQENVEFSAKLSDDVRASESLLMEIEYLSNLAVAIETYGISPGMMFVADREGLLASTFIGRIPATESMTGPYKPDSTTSTIALEGVMDAIKSKTAEWASKAGGVIKSVIAKADEAIKNAATWANTFTKTTANKIWDVTKATGKTIKAHPYKTIMIILAAIAAAAAVLAIIWVFPTQTSQIDTWRKRVINAITNIKTFGGKFVKKPPGSRIYSETRSGIDSRGIIWRQTDNRTVDAGPIVADVTKLGWTKNNTTSTTTSLFGVLNKILSVIHGPAQKVAMNFANNTYWSANKSYGGNFTDLNNDFNMTKSVYMKTFHFAVSMTWLLISTVVIGGYFLIKKTVSKVVSAVSGTSTKEEPATADIGN